MRASRAMYSSVSWDKTAPARFRHTMAHQFLADNANDQLLGHECINTTARRVTPFRGRYPKPSTRDNAGLESGSEREVRGPRTPLLLTCPRVPAVARSRGRCRSRQQPPEQK